MQSVGARLSLGYCWESHRPWLPGATADHFSTSASAMGPETSAWRRTSATPGNNLEALSNFP